MTTPATTTEPPAGTTLLPLRLGDETALLANQPKMEVKAKKVFQEYESLEKGVLGAGDTELKVGFLSKNEADAALHAFLNGEVEFQQWYHMPDKRNPSKALKKLKRIKAALCNPAPDGRIPLYRFPVNDQKRYGETIPMPNVLEGIRKKVSAYTGFDFNHAVVLLYKNGDDCIGFHKDKTLDLDEKAPIISLSLGAERPYVLRDNIHRPTIEQEFLFPHGAMLALGPKSNSAFYHSVRQLKKEEETSEPRISLTFRKVATFRDKDGKITGKGAKYQSLNWPTDINGAHRLDGDLENDIEKPTTQRPAESKSAKKKSQKKPKILKAEEVEEVLAEAEVDATTSLKEQKRHYIRAAVAGLKGRGVDVEKEGAGSELASIVGQYVARKNFESTQKAKASKAAAVAVETQ